EWKDVRRKEYGRRWLRITRGLRESIVEAAAPGPRHMRQHPVQRNTPFFICVETLIHKIAQETTVLRNAFAVDASRGRDGIRRVFCIGSEVAYRCKADAGHNRVSDDVDVFVDLPRLESSVQTNVPVARLQLATDGMGKLPFGPRDHRARCIARIANGERVA